MDIKSVKQGSILLLSVAVLLCCLCQKKSDDTKTFARIGWKVISQESFDAFKKMKRLYPASLYDFVYPGKRSNATLCVETEVIYKKAGPIKSTVKKSHDWKWKEKFFSAQMYLFDILEKNLGFSDEKVEAYYNKNKAKYKKTIQVKIPKDTTKSDSKVSDTASTDSTSKESVKDSVIYRPLNAVRSEIARILFLEENPPTPEFYASMADTSDSSKTVIDTPNVQDRWIQKMRRNLPGFFMKKKYEKRFGKEYPDSINEVYGEGKIITPQDMEVIMNWLPETSKENYKRPDKQKYLIEWLLKWLLFFEDAENLGFTKRKEVKQISKWAWKFEVVLQYLNGPVIKNIENNMVIDTSMCVYEHWDRTGIPNVFPDSASLVNIIESNSSSKRQVALDETIHTIRKKANVTFLQSDFVDERDGDPVKMAAEADSLYGAGKSKDAEKIYRKIIDNFPFSEKGLNALVELAKILTEKEKYRDAIKNYRRYLLFSSDIEKRCNIFFMVGFVYGEYLNKPELAEASYKWILKNTPECELADDAEFMCLHLDEPMIGVDELQAEAKRQGRKIEETEPVSEVEVKESEEGSES